MYTVQYSIERYQDRIWNRNFLFTDIVEVPYIGCTWVADPDLHGSSVI
jgi:hypothetical protein